MTEEHNSDDEASIDPEIVFGLRNGDDLVPLPDGASIEIRGPDGEDLAEIDTADGLTFAFVNETELTDLAGNGATTRTFFIRDQKDE